MRATIAATVGLLLFPAAVAAQWDAPELTDLLAEGVLTHAIGVARRQRVAAQPAEVRISASGEQGAGTVERAAARFGAKLGGHSEAFRCEGWICSTRDGTRVVVVMHEPEVYGDRASVDTTISVLYPDRHGEGRIYSQGDTLYFVRHGDHWELERIERAWNT